MKQEFYNLEINTNGQKLYEFTDETIEWIDNNNFKNGIINLSIQHTSASLIIQENADPDVQKDLINYFNYNPNILVVEYNKSILIKRNWKKIIIVNNDKIEIFTIVGGG